MSSTKQNNKPNKNNNVLNSGIKYIERLVKSKKQHNENLRQILSTSLDNSSILLGNYKIKCDMGLDSQLIAKNFHKHKSKIQDLVDEAIKLSAISLNDSSTTQKRIFIEAVPKNQKSGRGLVINVEDNSDGIPYIILDNILKIKNSEHPIRHFKNKCEKLGCRLTVDSVFGIGTKFIIEIF